MYELRWKQKLGNPDKGSVMVGDRISQTLQYRVMTNIEEVGIQEPIWSEWENVPVNCE